MLDSPLKKTIDPYLNKIGIYIAKTGITANQLTLLGFSFGIFAIPFIMVGLYHWALLFFLINRSLDGLDGSVARATHITDIGGFLDIVCDFLVYSGIVLGFIFVNHIYAIWAAILIFSFIGPISSFLAYAILAAKKNHHTERCGKKSFYYAAGLCEGTETLIALSLMILFPQFFPAIAAIYALMCWITTFGRIRLAHLNFKN